MVELDTTLTLPFRQIADGAIRIGSTRVSLETIIDSYLSDQRAEETHSGFSSIALLIHCSRHLVGIGRHWRRRHTPTIKHRVILSADFVADNLDRRFVSGGFVLSHGEIRRCLSLPGDRSGNCGCNRESDRSTGNHPANPPLLSEIVSWLAYSTPVQFW